MSAEEPAEPRSDPPHADGEFPTRTDREPLQSLLEDFGVAASALAEGPGGRIGPYKLLQQIGQGGFGVVFMAEQEAPVRRRVALKVIKLGMDTRQVVARFEQERQALALMDHPNIAKVLDAGATESGRPYFVMELVRGVSITEYCDAHHLGPRERLELFVPVCLAVQHAHHKGVIHRDLKPSNVLVALHDGKPVPKIIDFGIAKATDRPLTDKTLFTELRAMIGTPAYMSPEQAELSGLDVDTRSDVYSLGVLLYELLTGTTPFSEAELRAAGYAEMQRLIREVDPPRPSTRVSTLGDALVSVAARRDIEPRRLGAALRGELDWIVMKALEKDRGRRYDTAAGFAEDVKRHLAGQPVLAAPPGVFYRARKFARQHRGLATTVAAVGLVLLTANVVAAFLARQAAGLAEAAREKKEQAAKALEDTRRLVEQAKQQQEEAQHGLDLSHLRSAQEALAREEFERAGELLGDEAPVRAGFEWRYLAARAREVEEAVPGGRLAFDARGERFLTVLDETVHVFDAATRKELYPPLAHGARVQSACFSSDGARLLTAGGESARVWRTDNGGLEHVMRDPGAEKLRALFSPDGARVLTQPESGRLRLWDAATGDARADIEGRVGPFAPEVFSPDGGLVLSIRDDLTVRVVEIATGVEPEVLSGHSNRIGSAVFAPDGKHVLTVAQDGTARVWDWQERKASTVIPNGPRGWPLEGILDPLGTHAVLRDKSRIWLADPWSGRIERCVDGQSSRFGTDGSDLLFSDADGWALVDVRSGELLRRYADSDVYVPYEDGERTRSVSRSPKGAPIAVSTSRSSWLFGPRADLRARAYSCSLVERGGEDFSLHDQGTRAVVFQHGIECLWDLERMELVRPLERAGWQPKAAGREDGERIVTSLAAAGAGRARDGVAAAAGIESWLVRASDGAELARLAGEEDPMVAHAVSDDEQWLATLQASGAIWLRNASDGSAVRRVNSADSGGQSRLFDLRSVGFASSDRFLWAKNQIGLGFAWDLESGDLIARSELPSETLVTGRGDSAAFLEFASLAPRVVASTRSGKLRVIDLDRDPEHPLPEIEEGFSRLTWMKLNADGTRLITYAGDGAKLLWNTETGARAIQDAVCASMRSADSIHFSADGRRLAVLLKDGVEIYDAGSGRLLAKTERGSERIKFLCFDRTAQRAALWESDGTVRVRSVEPDEELGVWPAAVPGSRYRWGEFSPGRDRLLVSTESGAVLLTLDPRAIRPLSARAPESWGGPGFSFDEDDRHVIAQTEGYHARFDCLTGTDEFPPIEFAKRDESVACVEFTTRDGPTRAIVRTERGAAYLCDVTRQREPVRLWGERGLAPAGALAASAGNWLLTATGADARAQVWDLARGEEYLRLVAHEAPIGAVAITPSGARALTGSDDGTAILWDVAVGSAVGAPLVHGAPVTAVALDADARHASTAGGDRVLIWDLPSHRISEPLQVRQGRVHSVAFVREGSVLVTVSEHGAELWDTGSGKPLSEPLRGTGEVRAFAFSPDEHSIAVAFDEKCVRRFALPSGAELVPPLALASPAHCLAFDGEGGRLVAGSERGCVLFEPDGDAPARILGTEDAAVSCVAFASEGTRVLAVGRDRWLRVLDPARGVELLRLARLEGSPRALWSVGDRALERVIALTVEGTLQVWEVASDGPADPDVERQARPPRSVR